MLEPRRGSPALLPYVISGRCTVELLRCSYDLSEATIPVAQKAVFGGRPKENAVCLFLKGTELRSRGSFQVVWCDFRESEPARLDLF